MIFTMKILLIVFYSIQYLLTHSSSEMKFQRYFELKNYQQTKIIEIENTRVWLTNVYVSKLFNRFVRGQTKEDILKRVIINGSTGSSWLFKRFNKLQIIVADKTSFSNLFSSYQNSGMFFGVEDTQPELSAPENRKTVKFDFFFNGSEKSALKKRSKTLRVKIPSLIL